VTTTTDSHVRFDPYNDELIADRYLVFARLRDEALVYQAVLFLASDESRYITSVLLPVDAPALLK
jgi:NAD(P)-dependent dehydrogenase (short-subunit alcohol dehydrogenase family)